MTGGVRRQLADERGFVAGAEALVFGVLVFVFGTLVVVNAWRIVDASFAASAAAREAVRAAVDAPAGSSSADLEVAARWAAEQAVAAHGHPPASLSLAAGVPLTQTRCAPVQVTAIVEVQVTSLPLWRDRTRYEVTATAEAVIDPFRGGLPAAGEAPCGF